MLFRVSHCALVMLVLVSGSAFGAEPRSPQPSNNPGMWVTTADYPKDAFSHGDEGSVGFRVEVTPNGRVANCTITQSSGSGLLDSTTCSLIQSRARFLPALDQNGHSVAGTYRNLVRWVLPRERKNPDPGLLVFSALVSVDGHVSDCRIEQAEGYSSTNLKVGPLQPCGMEDLPHGYTDKNGKPVAKRFRRTIRVELLEVPPEQAAPLPEPTPAAAPARKD